MGSVFKIATATGTLTTVLQFGSLTGANATVNNPWNGLTSDGEGNLWGIATAGGGASSWAAYKIRISDGAFTKVSEIPPGGVAYKGRTPLAGLAGNSTSPWLWGTTSEGGTQNLGTLFRYNPSTGEYNTVIHFTGTTGTALGSKPNGKLHVDAFGVVWGTTELGGAFGSPTGYGTIFKYDPTAGIFTTVQSFNAGVRPKGALVSLSDGQIWGTTSSGLSGTVGTVFKIQPTTNAVTTVYSFANANSTTHGREPMCGLVEGAGGFVWGTAQLGGANSNSGMLFKIEMSTGTYTPVRSFASNSNPSGNLVADASGSIYGTTNTSIFKYVPGTSTYTDIFINESITIPWKGVTLGTLYKTSAGDIRFLGTEGTRDLAAPNNFYASLRSVIYHINTSTNAVTKLRVLAEGIVGPQIAADLPTVGGLHEHSDGSFYGITQSSGTDKKLKPAGGGMIYRVSTGPVAMTQPYDSTSPTAFYTLVSGTTATLRGYANPNGNATTCQFEWGPTTELGNIANANAPVGTGYTGGMCEAVLTGLPANRVIFFRLRANSTGEPSFGPIRSILTGAGVSSVTQEISVESPIGQPLTDNVTTVNLGRLRVGQSIKQAVVVRNLGQGVVGASDLTGLTASISGANADDFVITTPFDLTSLPFTSAMSTGLMVTFTPSGGGTRTATLTITSNDADEGSFEIPLTGTGLMQPEISVESPTSLVLLSDDGSYDFGSDSGNPNLTRTFTIRNTGNAPLSNLSVSVRGIHTGDFAVTNQPPASIAAGASATFTATFTPTITGIRSATLHIASDDEDENPFLLRVVGTSVNTPEIQVLDGQLNLVDGTGLVPFGSLAIGNSAVRTITIRNTGAANLTGISLSLVGANAADFSFGSVASSIPIGQEITFNLTFFPQALGEKSATLRIASNDLDENPFDISLTGAAATAAKSWQPLTNGLPANPSIGAIAGNSDGSDLFIGVGLPVESVGIYRSTDNGLTWTKTANGPASNPNTAVSASEMLVHGTTVIATRFTNNGELFYSHDSGASWHHATGIPNNSARPVGQNGGVVDLARDGSTYYCQVLPQGPYKSTDGGQTWTPANTGITGLGSYIRTINGRVFASQGNTGFWSSDNQGASWTLRSTTPPLSYATPPRLTTIGDRIVLAAFGSTQSVLSAVAGEGTWVGSDAGLPTGSRHSDIETSATAIFSAGGTMNAGGQQIPYIAQSNNAGQSWSPLSAGGLGGAETTWHYASEICVHNGYLFAATYSNGNTHRFARLALTNGEFPQAPTIVTQPTPAALTMGVGQSATFQALASGSGTLTYQWSKGGVPLDGKTSPTLTLTNLQTTDNGSYTVAVTNGTETVVSNPAVLTVSPNDPGKLDYSFDAPISKVYSGTTLYGGTAYKVWPQTDGKILVAGDFDRVAVTPGNPFPTGGSPCTNIARFTATGALDPSFTLATQATGGIIKALAVQTDGKILIGGTFTSYAGTPRNRLARLNPNGTLDTSFMASGTGFNAEVLEILVQPNGRILVGGSFTTVHAQARANLVRLLDNGDRDTDFLPSLAGPNNTVHALALAGENLYVGGTFGSFNAVQTGAIAKCDLTGVRDTNFNSGAQGITSSTVFDLAVQTDGKLVATGSFTSYNITANAASRIIRLTSTGGIDSVFGAGLGAAGKALAIQPDGKIIVSGSFTSAGGATRNRLARFLATGTLDTDFNPGVGPNSTPEHIALQNDGKLLAAGAFTTYDNVTRYLLARIHTGSPALVLPDPLADFLASANVPANLRGPNDDADNDGFDNLLEYALDLNPNSSGTGGAFTGSIPALTSTPTLLQFTYRRARADVTYVVETSPTLSGGTWTSIGVTQGTPDGNGTTTASISITPGSAFLRLSVSR